MLNETTSGGITFNDCILHVGAKDAPFGGVGTSGMGYYHGPYGVNAFSYLRTYVELPSLMDKVMGFRYPPYTDRKTKQITDAQTRRAWFDRDGRDQRSGWRTLSVLVFSITVGGMCFWVTQPRTA